MCISKDCPVQSKCGRHKASGAKANPSRQLFHDFIHKSEHGCEFFTAKRAEIKRLNLRTEQGNFDF